MWIAPVPLPTHLTFRRGGCIGRAARAHSGTFASIRKFYLTPIRHICVYICVASDDLGWAANERFPAPEPCRAPPFPPNPGRCHILGAAATRKMPHPNPGRCHILGASATWTLPHPGSATSRTLPQRRMAGGGVQDSRSMQPRIRKAHLLIAYVLDSCVKLLAVLHISSAQGRSVDRTSAGSS